MIISTSNIKKGLCIIFNNEIYKIIEFLHVKPGKGPAFIRTKLKNFITGRIIENNFISGHKIKEINLEYKIYIFLYKNKINYYFMNIKDYNQISIEKKYIKKYKFLKSGQEVIIIYKENNKTPFYVKIPSKVILKVIDTEIALKGDTVTNTNKYVKLETGLIIQVPLFINIGDNIKINTENSMYIERIK
ncbi:elongation factor P [Candidatus Karelsulcia muelleri]|uniref:Elongation factor P n=1 Tax=Candidatus Karelsulcia muelleri PSPU TaxID=1189303 RepID=A0AAD1EXD1_9FLAO|nr:elongation factor P [Candidatus Karelsulcia muelleri]BAO66324.1 elongation factor P [Candidatus Karelsulcia muelleri PSPU]